MAGMDPSVEIMVNAYKERVNEANELASLIAASNTDYESVFKDVSDNYETEEVLSLQAQIEALEETLNAIYKAEAERVVNEASANATDLTAVKAKFASLKSGVKGLFDFLTGTAGLNADDLPKIKGTKGGSGSRSAGQSGTFRIRGYNWTFEGTTYANLSQAAKLADLDVKVIGEYLTRQHGEDRKSWPQSLLVELEGKKIEASKKEEGEE